MAASLRITSHKTLEMPIHGPINVAEKAMKLYIVRIKAVRKAVIGS